jgi:tetratricopeptide (TPR) repeat protein
VKLRPDYADAYTNIGLTNIEWEKYESARGGLEKALELDPNNARALYYLALVERRAGHSDAEVDDLQRVLAQYPQSRDVRRELGVSYYQQRRPKEAMEQFEALQAIDPDDLTAHYNLAILYRRMGMKDKAKEQLAMFVTKKLDPAAPTYSMDFLHRHPEISVESVPWHVHTDLPHRDASQSLPIIAKAP